MKDYCTIQEAIAILNERGAGVSETFVRGLCANLPFTRPRGAVRVYRVADVKSAFELSFKTQSQRAKAIITKARQKELN